MILIPNRDLAFVELQVTSDMNYGYWGIDTCRITCMTITPDTPYIKELVGYWPDNLFSSKDLDCTKYNTFKYTKR